MNFIKKIFEDNIDEMVHNQFSRFGKGEYERAYVTITKGKSIKLKTSFEFSNDFVSIIANNAKDELAVNGKIIADFDFQTDVDAEVTKRGKLYSAIINKNYTPEKLKELYGRFRLHALLLSINSPGYKLKCTTSLPKPGGKIKNNFCSATLPLELLNEFAFDIKEDFKKAEIKHTYLITDIEIPEEYKDDFAKARYYAKRKGKIIRSLNIDGKEKIVEKEFSA